MGFTPHMAEQPLQGMDLQQKEEDKDEKNIEKFAMVLG